MANLNFDATNIAPSTPFEPLKPGWYPCTIVSAGMKASEKADEMVTLQFEVIGDMDPENGSRRIFTNLCIHHPTNQKTREIAAAQLSAIAHSIGILQIADTDELLGKQLLVKVKSVPAKGEYEAKHEPTDYKPLDGSPFASKAKASAAAATTAPATTAAKPSWRK